MYNYYYQGLLSNQSINQAMAFDTITAIRSNICRAMAGSEVSVVISILKLDT